ncbi:MAG: type II secretion system protein GspK [Pseudomonadota bacterium]
MTLRRNFILGNSGMALLITLALVSILTVAALEIARKVASSTDGTLVHESRFIINQMAMSGIHLAMAVLADDANTNEIDSVQELWANSGEMSQVFARMHPLADAVSLEITDELGKIQVNALIREFPGSTFNDTQRELWERLLAMVVSGDKSVDLRDPQEIINCIKDWLDSGDDDTITGTSGAESSYYETLEPSVYCSNGPIDILKELYNIKGVSQDILTVKSIMQESSLFEGMSQAPELDSVLSVFGMNAAPADNGGFAFQGRININTAGPLILAAMLPAGREDQAQELADFRTQTHETGGDFVNTLDKGWYEQVIELSDKEKLDFGNIIRYSSDYFRVRASVRRGTVEQTLLAYIKREKDKETGRWYCRLLRLSRE